MNDTPDRTCQYVAVYTDNLLTRMLCVPFYHHQTVHPLQLTGFRTQCDTPAIYNDDQLEQ